MYLIHSYPPTFRQVFWLHRHNKVAPSSDSAAFSAKAATVLMVELLCSCTIVVLTCSSKLVSRFDNALNYDISSRATSNISCVCWSFFFKNLQKSLSFSNSSSFSLHSLVMLSFFFLLCCKVLMCIF